LSADAEQAGKRVREISTRQDRNRALRVRSRGLAQESKRWSQAEKDAKARMKALDNQLRAVDSKLADYPNQSKYTVDCLALKTSQKHLDLPVYNHGWLIKQARRSSALSHCAKTRACQSRFVPAAD
jgi:hypothetical protein